MSVITPIASPMVNSDGTINTGVAAYIQENTANQVSRSSFASHILANESVAEDARVTIADEQSKVSRLVNAAIAHEVRDEDAQKFYHEPDEDEDDDEDDDFDEELENYAFYEDEASMLIHTASAESSFIGKILNLKI